MNTHAGYAYDALGLLARAQLPVQAALLPAPESPALERRFSLDLPSAYDPPLSYESLRLP